MSPAPLQLVLDASVGIKTVLRESLSDRVQEMFDRLSEEPAAAFHVPDLFYLECASILRKRVRKFGLSSGEARRSLAFLLGFPLRATPSAELAREALDLALARGLTAYDAAYVALSDRLRLPLVTADARLASDLAGTPHDIRFLGELDV